jgi:hypothetical protein
VRALAVDGNGSLFAGGDFTKAGGKSAAHIAKWNGSDWTATDSGMDKTITALVAEDSGTTVYAGGPFTIAGGKPSNYLGRAYQVPTIYLLFARR